MGRGCLKKGAEEKKSGWLVSEEAGSGFGAAVAGVGQSQYHFTTTALGWSGYNPSWYPEHQDPALPPLYKHSTSVGQCFSGTDQGHINCSDLGIPLSSLLCPSNCLALYAGLGAEGP